MTADSNQRKRVLDELHIALHTPVTKRTLLSNTKNDISLKMLIPLKAVGFVIGLRGEDIKQTKAKTDCFLQVSKHHEILHGERYCEMRGRLYNIWMVIKGFQAKIVRAIGGSEDNSDSKIRRCDQIKIAVPFTMLGYYLDNSERIIKEFDSLSCSIEIYPKVMPEDSDAKESIITVTHRDQDVLFSCIFRIMEILLLDKTNEPKDSTNKETSFKIDQYSPCSESSSELEGRTQAKDPFRLTCFENVQIQGHMPALKMTNAIQTSPIVKDGHVLKAPYNCMLKSEQTKQQVGPPDSVNTPIQPSQLVLKSSSNQTPQASSVDVIFQKKMVQKMEEIERLLKEVHRQNNQEKPIESLPKTAEAQQQPTAKPFKLTIPAGLDVHQSSNLLEHVESSLKESDFPEEKIPEVISAMATLAKYNLVGMGLTFKVAAMDKLKKVNKTPKIKSLFDCLH